MGTKALSHPNGSYEETIPHNLCVLDETLSEPSG